MRGDGTPFKRGRVWYGAYWYKGKRVRERIPGATNKTEAGDWLREKIASLKGGRTLPADRRYSVEDACKAYLVALEMRGKKSVKATESHLQPIIDRLGKERCIDLDSERVEKFTYAMLKALPRRGTNPLGPATVNRRFHALRAALRWAKRKGRIAIVPEFVTLGEPPARQGFLEPGDFEAVLLNLPEHLQDLALFAYVTGWRKSEVLGLRWERVNRKGGEIRLATSKNELPRTLVLVKGIEGLDGTSEIIERRWTARRVELAGGAHRIAEFVFHDNGEPIRDFRRAWRSACEAAGLAGRLFHDMRRSAVRNLVRAHVPQSIAMSISGHKTSSVFRRYDIIDGADQATAIRQTLEALARNRERSVVPIAEAAKAKGSK